MVLCLLYANLIYFLLNTEAPKWASSMYLTNSPFKPSSIIKMSTQSLYRVVPKQFILKDNLLFNDGVLLKSTNYNHKERRCCMQ